MFKLVRSKPYLLCLPEGYFIALTLSSFAEWAGIIAFDKISRNPIRYPLSFAGMLVGLLGAVLIGSLIVEVIKDKVNMTKIILWSVCTALPFMVGLRYIGQYLPRLWK